MNAYTITAEQSLAKLKEGNKRYMDSVHNPANISRDLRLRTCNEGQHPYAIIVTCSDSRVIPESIFSAGIGDLFVIRVAGYVMDDHQLGSIEYASEYISVDDEADKIVTYVLENYGEDVSVICGLSMGGAPLSPLGKNRFGL